MLASKLTESDISENGKMNGDCDHVNVYRDDFQREWHCDDCGECFGERPSPNVGHPVDSIQREMDAGTDALPA